MLKGLLIKLGQLLSVTAGVLPKAYEDALESFQDNTSERPFEIVESQIEEYLGRKWQEVFASIDRKALASASIGQVHKATLLNGEAVVIKIQHKEIEAIAHLDLKIIKRLVQLASFLFGIRGADNLYKELKSMTLQELDYLHEAKVMLEIAHHLKDRQDVIIPKCYRDWCSSRMLVMEYAEGQNMGTWNKDGLRQPEMDEIIRLLIALYAEMILKHGVYHADPHPGNLLITPDGQLVLVDFGAVGRLSPNTQKAIPHFIQAILKKDLEGVVNSMRDMGFVGSDESEEEFALHLVGVVSDFLNNELDIQNININHLEIEDIRKAGIEKLLRKINLKELAATFQIPKDWVILQGTLSILQGVCKKMAPDVNPVEEVKPHLKAFFMNRENLQELILSTIKQQLLAAVSLPSDLSKFLNTANRGKMRMEVKGYQLRTKLIYGFSQQLIYAILASLSAWGLHELESTHLRIILYAALGFSIFSFLNISLKMRKWVRKVRL